MFRLLALSVLCLGLIFNASFSYASINNVSDINKQAMEAIDDENVLMKKKLKTKKATTKNKALKYASVNINTASIEELSLALKRIGKTKATAIVDYRSKNGKFKTLDDLLKVKGIGHKLLNTNKERIRISGDPAI